jgi:trehalose 6-phosphate synthase/phosphatase
VLDKEVLAEKQKLRATTKGQKIILSIDRLDYTKGIDKRLQAFELFLEKHPQYLGKVVLEMVAIPSRTEIFQYQEMKKDIDELVGKINGRFGTISWTPIIYQYKSLTLKELLALYSESVVALVTPLRDGMNMIAKEYIACRRDLTGVLVLSEMAGASSELGEAIIVNPNHVEEIANALQEALEMPKEQQMESNQLMQARLKR